MPVEAKPLFRPDVLRARLGDFDLPATAEPARSKFRNWAEIIRSGRIDSMNERELLPDFLTDWFVTLLGYDGPPGLHGTYTLSRERHVEVDGQFADAALGNFSVGGSNQFVVVVEGKGPRDPLERPHAGRRMSAVDQGYKYAVNLACDWIVITNIRQTRLYFKGANQQTYERFDTERLADDSELLKKLVFLLGASRVLPLGGGRSHLYDLMAASERAGRELTKEFYRAYAEMREAAFDKIATANPTASRTFVLTATQKLLDRLLFCAFCEDRGLLPPLSIQRAFQHADPYNPRPVWENFKGLFRAVDEGNERLSIPRYNGGLFARDAELDALVVPDDVLEKLHTLGDYDYRPPHEAAGEIGSNLASTPAPLVDVDISGHIFEQSITDLERLRESLAGGTDSIAEKNDRRSRRKREGAFYTPPFVTRYIVEQALGGVLKERFEDLRQRHEGEATKATKAALVEITKTRQTAARTVLDWLRMEFDVTKPTLKLQAPVELDAEAFVAEVKKSRGKGKLLTAAMLAALRAEHAQTIGPARATAAEASALEHRLSDLVNAAYGLTAAEVQLMWKTAPPRTPLAPTVEGLT